MDYKIVNGTSYHADTPNEVMKWLEISRERHQRIRIFYGKDKRCWNEEHDIIGTVSRSRGTRKVPLLIQSSRSIGGSAILDDCIVRIDTKGSNGKIETVYRDASIKFDHFISTDIGTVYNETKDKIYARCKSGESGRRLAAFMNGKRWSK